MGKISFSVSARTALLIGQQNFTNAEGAIIELVKNGYDADGQICAVVFDIPFPEFPSNLSVDTYRELQEDAKGFHQDFYLVEGSYHLREEIQPERKKLLQEYFHSKNSIYIIDNGSGMDADVITKNWMTIGTGNKEIDYRSDTGRIRTGAKGIGRFALDRLGELTNMWTFPQESESGYYWEMNWKQFETPNLQLGDIKADLYSIEKLSMKKKINEDFGLFSFFGNLPIGSFDSGTIIRIGNLRDQWLRQDIEQVFKSLEALIPPRELKIPFRVFQGYFQSPMDFGEVETAFFDDYDYKLVGRYDSETTSVTLDITRNELDIKLVSKKFKTLFEQVPEPYDLPTLKKKEFQIQKPVNNLLRWPKTSSNVNNLKKVGDFEFTFYYLKNVSSKKEDYPYKVFSPKERDSVLNRFGGIKIYRDSFRVRPYGDPGNDWLDLGRRVSKSPAGAGQRVGDWRVGSNQVAGIINISRIENELIVDKSDRGALVENIYFELFKKIIIGMIAEFEYDRTKILHPFYLHNEEEKKRIEQERINTEAVRLAELLYQQRKEDEENNRNNNVEKGDEENAGTSSSQKHDEEEEDEKERLKKIIEESLQKFTTGEEKDAEIAQVRNLASLGLIMSSFAHELRGIKNNIPVIPELEEIYKQLVPKELKTEESFQDGLDIIDLLKVDSEKIQHWVEYSLTAIKRDKRQRTNLEFNRYFKTLKKDWKLPLADREITLQVNEIDTSYQFRAFEMDMNTIFSNLISNSIDAFNNVDEIIDRKISISHQVEQEKIIIEYADNATGLPEVFSNREDIFLPFTTSKKDKYGADVGTGLGMYLVQSVITDNAGKIEILSPEAGFAVKIEFPTRKD